MDFETLKQSLYNFVSVSSESLNFIIKTDLWILLTSLTLLTLLIFNRNYPEFYARLKVKFVTSIFLFKEHYELLHDVNIVTQKGESIKIKQLLISRYGLFIIDTQHYRDEIYGSHYQVNWLSRSKRHYQPFKSPHIMNEELCKKLESHLYLKPKTCQSIVIFTGNCHFPNGAPDNTCTLKHIVPTIIKNSRFKINDEIYPLLHDVIRLKPRKLHSVENYAMSPG